MPYLMENIVKVIIIPISLYVTYLLQCHGIISCVKGLRETKLTVQLQL